MAVIREVGGVTLIDVLDRILDKGIVIDAWIHLSLVGIDFLAVEARMIASVETCLSNADTRVLSRVVSDSYSRISTSAAQSSDGHLLPEQTPSTASRAGGIASEITLQRAGKREPEMSNDSWTGCPVPENGFYRIRHSQHRLPKEVTLFIGQSFPRCSKCSESVYFELIRCAPSLGMTRRSDVALYELPELAEQDESLAG